MTSEKIFLVKGSDFLKEFPYFGIELTKEEIQKAKKDWNNILQVLVIYSNNINENLTEEQFKKIYENLNNLLKKLEAI